MFPMGLLANGERAEVVSGIPALEHCNGLRCGPCQAKGREGSAVRLEDMGIRPGKEVEMLNNGGGGALLVKVDDSRIAVGRGMAMKIMVRRQGR
ncbi:MAG TPA: FeoA family protein [Candidatus Deferrimicrobium sp.]|jgi:ferrous iron transport protein A|nr:FeoA family protein [Candidatus Deferrimicrobium sp.]